MKEAHLSHTQAFFLVARDGSYSAAARKLNISYQSVANQVRRLERLAGESLVVSRRGIRTVKLTPRGQSLFKLLEPEFESVLARLSSLLERERPMIRIGIPQAAFYYLLPPVLEAFSAIHPSVEVIAYERDTELMHLAKQSMLDVWICERHFGDPECPQRLIGHYTPVLAYPKSWAQPPSDSAGLARWAREHAFVTYEPGQLLREIALDLLAGERGRPDVAISASASLSIKRCVEGGLGYSVLPGWCIEPEDRKVAVSRLRRAPKIPIYFGEAVSLKNNEFVKTLRKLCNELILPRLT